MPFQQLTKKLLFCVHCWLRLEMMTSLMWQIEHFGYAEGKLHGLPNLLSYIVLCKLQSSKLGSLTRISVRLCHMFQKARCCCKAFLKGNSPEQEFYIFKTMYWASKSWDCSRLEQKSLQELIFTDNSTNRLQGSMAVQWPYSTWNSGEFLRICSIPMKNCPNIGRLGKWFMLPISLLVWRDSRRTLVVLHMAWYAYSVDHAIQ